MELFIKVFNITFPVFSIIGVGYLFGGYKKLNVESLIELLIYLTVPALVLSSLLQKKIILTDLYEISAAALFVMAASAFLTYIYLKSTGQTNQRGVYLATVFMNTGNLPFPIAFLAFGTDGLAIAVIYYIVISIMAYTLGITMAKGDGGIKEFLKMPLIYASVLGIALNLMDTAVPKPLMNTFEMLGAATIPIMQIALGYQLRTVKIHNFFEALWPSLIRVVGGFLAAFLFVTVFDINGLNRTIILISSSMPSAVITFVLAYRYNVQKDLVASIVALSTFLSLISIPVLLAFLL